MSKLTVSRRQFLGTTLAASTVLTAFPSKLWAAGPGTARDSEVVLRAAIMSDVHFKKHHSPERERLEKVMRFLPEYAKDSAYPKFDAVMVVGDMSDHGYAAELVPFRDILYGNLPEGAQALLCMGNHEHWGGEEQAKSGGARKHWEKIFSRPVNSHTVINGFHFIGISPEKGTCADGDYLYALDWLRQQLETAVKEDPKKPVFVFQHYHVRGTVYGGMQNDWAGVKDLRPLFEEFPQVINFSGHSHYPSNDPRSAWQEKFTAFGTATLSYYAMEGGKFNRFPNGYQNAGQVYFMEVFKDNAVHFRIYDVISGTFFDTDYLVAEPGAVEKYCYTEKRYETAENPYWTTKSAPRPNLPGYETLPEVKISEIYPYSAQITIPQAHDTTCSTSFLGSYQISLEQRKTGTNDEWEFGGEENPWSDYFYKNQGKEITAELASLEPEYDWKVSVRARNVYGKLSEEVICTEFQTPADPEAERLDRKAPNPVADVLNFYVTEDGKAVNEPFRKTFQKPLEQQGKPVLANAWAEFNGETDRFRIRFTKEDYARLRRGITLGASFTFDAFGKNVGSILANTESGGACLSIDPASKTIRFWCHVAGRYTILSVPITPGSHTVYGTYDGKNLTLYLDGVQAAQQKASGPLTYTQTESARAYSIGSDIASGYGANAFFKGKIQYARVYSWALTLEQIKNQIPGNEKK